MSHSRLRRSAVRSDTPVYTRYYSVPHMIDALAPNEPVHCIRPQVMKHAAQWFLGQFPGDVLYAVKTNPDPAVLHHLYDAGVRHFDVASLVEVDLVRRELPDASLYFMHPVKNREAIRVAYEKYGVRDFSLDSFAELQKIMEATGNARDLGLHIRLSVPKADAAHDLSGKFGIAPEDAVRLLKQARKVSERLGICFHVGSQCMDPGAYRAALLTAHRVVTSAKVRLDVIDVGGGFPSLYPDYAPPALSLYMEEIRSTLAEIGWDQTCQVWCEPGRALVAEAGSLVVRVELRKGNMLYINDGMYGSLFDAGALGLQYPTRIIRPKGRISTRKMAEFSFYGPTCDSLDVMKGPFLLPATIREGDWIEIGQLGAYGATMQSRFNGFFSDVTVEVCDAPMLSMFSHSRSSDLKSSRLRGDSA